MKKNKKYIYHEVLAEIALEDLDLEVQDYVFGLNEDGHDYDGTITKTNDNKYWWNGENNYLEIDKLIKALQKLKKKGATHVDITPHGDHHGYYFYGSIFRQATDEEIEEEIMKNKDDRRKMLKTKMEMDENNLANDKKELEELTNECNKFKEKRKRNN